MADKYRERILKSSGISHKRVQSQYAMKLMQKMGWSQGKGLGKKESGMTDCLQIKRREDGQGLGIKTNNSQSFDWKDQWWNTSYNESVKKLKIVVPKKKSKVECSSSDDSSDDSSSSSSSGPALLKTKNIKKQKSEENKKKK